MATEVMYPTSDPVSRGSGTIQSMPGNGTAADFDTYVDDTRGSYDDTTSYVRINYTGGASYFIVDGAGITGAAAGITSVDFQGRAQRTDAAGAATCTCAFRQKDHSNGETLKTAHTENGTWNTKTYAAASTNPDNGSAAWLVSDVSSSNVAWRFIQDYASASGYYVWVTGMNSQVIYTPAAGGWRWMLQTIVPPILGAGFSHVMDKAEIFQNFFRRDCKPNAVCGPWEQNKHGWANHGPIGSKSLVAPSTRWEWEELERELTVRPKFVFMGA